VAWRLVAQVGLEEAAWGPPSTRLEVVAAVAASELGQRRIGRLAVRAVQAVAAAEEAEGHLRMRP
jgi:hypothetical protein